MSSYGPGPQGYREAKEGYQGEGNPSEAAARQVGGDHYLGKTITHWGIVDEYGATIGIPGWGGVVSKKPSAASI